MSLVALEEASGSRPVKPQLSMGVAVVVAVHSGGPGGRLEAELVAAAPQTVYRGGVPHTDRHGRRRTEFDPSASFLPLGLCASL